MTRKQIIVSTGAVFAALLIALVGRAYLIRPLHVSARAVAPTEQISPEAMAAIQRMQVAQGPQRAQLALIEAETDAARRTEAVQRTVDAVNPEDFGTTLGALLNVPGEAAVEFRAEILRRWTASNPSAAAQWAAQLPDGPATHEVLGEVASLWAETDRAAATAWLESLRDGESRQSATMGVGYVVAADEPVAALNLASALPASTERDDLLNYALSQWAAKDSTAALQWAGQIPDATLRQQMLATAAIALAATDAPAAAAIVGTQIKSGPLQDRAAVSVVQQWAQTSPQAAAKWVNLFPDSPVRTAALQALDTTRRQQLASASGSL